MTAGSGSRARPSDTIEVRREGLSLKPKRAPSRAPAVSRNAESMVRAVSGNSRSAVICGPRSESASTVRSILRKFFHDQQSCRGLRTRHFFMFKNPRISVWHEHRIHSCGQGRIDVRLWAVAHHPAGFGEQIVFRNDLSINSHILLRDDLYRREVLLQTGALDFSSLLRNCALGHQNQVMSLGKIAQRFRDSWNDLDGMLGNGMSKAIDGFVQRRSERLDRQALEGIDQSVSKTVQPIPMLEDALTLDVVQDCKYLLRRLLVMIQERDEVRDRPLEVDIVLPERVVGINEEMLCSVVLHFASHDTMIAGWGTGRAGGSSLAAGPGSQRAGRRSGTASVCCNH